MTALLIILVLLLMIPGSSNRKKKKAKEEIRPWYDITYMDMVEYDIWGDDD